MKALSISLAHAFSIGFAALANAQNVENPPPPAAWTVTASSAEGPEFAAQRAADGDYATRWSSAFSDPQWLAVDLGCEVTLCGVTIHWEAAYAASYVIAVSADGQAWHDVFAEQHGDGGVDDVYFGPVAGRYVRLLGRERATGWGYSVREFEVKGPAELVRVVAEPGGGAVERLFDGAAETAWVAGGPGEVVLTIDFRKARPLAGLRIEWGRVFARGLDLAVSGDGTNWRAVTAPPFGAPTYEMLLHEPVEARYYRLALSDPSAAGPIEIRELALADRAAGGDPRKLYEVAAALSPPGAYPEQLRKRQVYWTVVGLPLDSEESLFDEYGNLEPKQGSSTLMAFVYAGGRLYSPVASPVCEQSLADGRLPLPSVVWSAGAVRVEAMALTRGPIDESVTYVRYRLTNTGAERAAGQFMLAVRPMQINPTWQHGGLAAIGAIQVRPAAWATVAEIGNQPAFLAMPSATRAGARPFDRGDVARELLRGQVPEAAQASDASGLASAALAYDFDLAPGAQMTVVAAAPLHGAVGGLAEFRKLGADAGAAFAAAYADQVAFWRRRLAGPVIVLPDAKVVDMLVAQIGYMLINRDGTAVEPGPRNYSRSWMRDGGSSMAALLRMGLNEDARSWLAWYAARVQPSGLVPPILTGAGEVYSGWGANLEWDSQGQFLHALAEYYRFTGDEALLRGQREQVAAVVGYVARLREQTLAEGYRSDQPAAERFRGLLPPSISHEGYDPPMHSLWDDFWALKGLADARWLAERFDWPEVAESAGREYAGLRAAVQQSIAATGRHFQIDYVPGCADKGDFDATSTAIALGPGDLLDLFDRGMLQRTFDRYYQELAERRGPDWSGKFTPYEVRSINAFVALGQVDRANELLDYMLACRRPAGWNELAEVVHADARLGGYIGDMPHTWVGAEYVNAVRGMLVQERAGRLVLLAGVLPRWVEQGEGIRIERLPTYFGLLDLTARVVGSELVVRIGGEARPPDGYELHVPGSGAVRGVRVDGAEVAAGDGRVVRLGSGVREVRVGM